MDIVAYFKENEVKNFREKFASIRSVDGIFEIENKYERVKDVFLKNNKFEKLEKNKQDRPILRNGKKLALDPYMLNKAS